MNVIRRIATLFGCLLSVALFGTVGVAATWVLVTSVRDAQQARDWVKVRADVVSTNVSMADAKPSIPGRGAGIYRYQVGEQEFTGSRLGSMTIAGADPFDDWQDAMQDFLKSASDEKRHITVNVNPDNPALAMVDRDLRWGMITLLFPFAFVFSLIAVGSLYGFVRVLLAPSAAFARASPVPHPAGVWVFAIIWNVISFPVAGAIVPEIVRNGDWEGWLILIFPLVGVLIALSGIKDAIKYHKTRWRRAS